jgi:GT2 family glycosyltransferase
MLLQAGAAQFRSTRRVVAAACTLVPVVAAGVVRNAAFPLLLVALAATWLLTLLVIGSFAVRASATTAGQKGTSDETTIAHNQLVQATSKQNATEPVVTVVVPSYDAQAFLAEALDSLQAQLLTQWHCIVVDDGSSDATASIASRYVEFDDRFTLIQHPMNRGLSAARNSGLAAATTRYIAFLDADDFLTPLSLADRVETLARANDDYIVGAYCGIVMVPEQASRESVKQVNLWTNPGLHDFVTTLGDCPFNSHAPLLRTAVLRAHGGFDETMVRGGEDWDLWLRLMRSGYYFVPSKFFGGAYRQRAASMVHTDTAEHLALSQELLASAHRKVDTQPQPLLHEPAIVYDAQVRLAIRTLRFAGIQASNGEIERATDLLQGLDPTAIELIRRRHEPSQLLREGIIRGMALVPHSLTSEHHQTVQSLTDQLALMVPSLPTQPGALDEEFESSS